MNSVLVDLQQQFEAMAASHSFDVMPTEHFKSVVSVYLDHILTTFKRERRIDGYSVEMDAPNYTAYVVIIPAKKVEKIQIQLRVK